MGDDLLFLPVLDKNVTQMIGYFPANITFYDLLFGEQIINKTTTNRNLIITNYINDYVPVY